MSDPDDDAIKVSVRIRPLNERELNANQKEGFEYSSNSLLEKTASGQKVYRFDHCFGPPTNNGECYDKVGRSLVLHAMDGFNATIFTYGQTGSGKTHSILGNDEDPGFIPRCIEDVFAYVDDRAGDADFDIRVSYLEVYNEEINDLLTEGDAGQNLRIVTEDPQKGAIIENLQEVKVGSRPEVFQVIAKGEEQRSYGSTQMNATSSRSHTLFRLVIESRTTLTFEGGDDLPDDASSEFTKLTKQKSAAGGSTKLSYLNLIDLAGSERQKSTGAAGSQLKEGSNINKSLLALGAVISKLGESARKGSRSKGTFIPFRDSKLTRILKNSLGGNTLTSILCTVTAATMHHDETVSTLKFGQLCKTIKNNARKNEVIDEKTLLRQYRSKISELTHQLAVANGEEPTSPGKSGQRRSLQRSKSDITGMKLAEALELAEREKQRSAEVQQRLEKLQEMVFEKRKSFVGSLPGGLPSPTSAGGRTRTRSASVMLQLQEHGSIPEEEEGADGMRSMDFSQEVSEQQAEEIELLSAQVLELQRERENDRSEIAMLRKLKDQLHKKNTEIAELEDRIAELEDRLAEQTESQEKSMLELQDYLERRQEELDTLTEQIDARQGEMDTQEEAQSKRKSRLEEMENNLSSMLAVLDEKESELQQQMNQLTQNIRIWEAEKQELQTREDAVLLWSKEFKSKEWNLEEHEKRVVEREQQLLEKEKKVKIEEKRLKEGEKQLNKEIEAHKNRMMKLEAGEKNLDDATTKVTDWKRILKSREIEVEERERNSKKKEENLRVATENLDVRDKEVTQLKHELSTKDEQLLEREYQIEQDHREIERLRPALEAKQRDLDRMEENLRVESEKVEEGSRLNKQLATEYEEKQLEITIKKRHLEEREGACFEKEKLLKEVDSMKSALDQRALKQELKEEQWVNNIAQVNSHHAAALAEMEEHLSAQIRSAQSYDEELSRVKEELEREKKSKDVAMKKLKNVQDKFEEQLLKGQAAHAERDATDFHGNANGKTGSFLQKLNKNMNEEKEGNLEDKTRAREGKELVETLKVDNIDLESVEIKEALIGALGQGVELLEKFFEEDTRSVRRTRPQRSIPKPKAKPSDVTRVEVEKPKSATKRSTKSIKPLDSALDKLTRVARNYNRARDGDVLKAAFADFSMDAEDFKLQLKRALNLNLTLSEAKAIIDHYDRDGDGELDGAEFLIMFFGMARNAEKGGMRIGAGGAGGGSRADRVLKTPVRKTLQISKNSKAIPVLAIDLSGL